MQVVHHLFVSALEELPVVAQRVVLLVGVAAPGIVLQLAQQALLLVLLKVGLLL